MLKNTDSLASQSKQEVAITMSASTSIKQTGIANVHAMIKANLIAIYAIIFSLAKLFNSRCYVCHAKCKTGKYFAIHHITYIPGEKIYSDFKDDKGKPDRLAYYTYLAPIVRANPKRFALLCNTHHTAVTHLTRFKKDKRARLFKLAMQSI